jgi:uridine kinase
MYDQVVREIADRVIKKKGNTSPLCVGIDGIDASGKTYLANELTAFLTKIGHPILHASIDGFHNPRQIRHRRGSYSPEGYYFDSFNYELLKKCLLEPLSPKGSRIYRLQAYDFKTETEIDSGKLRATNDNILIFEGVFLMRREIEHYWDLKIFIDVDFETCIKRALKRDLYLFGSAEEILKRYEERYIPGQKMYLKLESPKEKADIIIDNNDFKKPLITTHGGTSDNTCQ